MLDSLGAETRRVRLPRDLDGLDGIVLPGGESTTIDKLARAFDLAAPLADAARSGLPVLATCAGLIYSARELTNPAPGQQTLSILDVTVERNAFGNQRFSEERVVDVDGIPVEASFIRAPLVTRVGDGVEVIATVERAVSGAPGELAIVGVRQGAITALSFHPEENGDARVHAAWLESLR